MKSYILVCLLAIFLSSSLHSQERYWYSKDCSRRFWGELTQIDYKFSKFQIGSKEYVVSASCLASSDQFFASGILTIDRAAVQIGCASWAPDAELRIALELLKSVKVARESLPSHIIRHGIPTWGREELPSLPSQYGWVEINGVQYEVSDAPENERLTGYDSLEITLPSRAKVAVPSSQTDRFVVLPDFWHPTFNNRVSGQEGTPDFRFVRRGPPANLDAVYLPEDEDRHLFVYSPIGRVWTERHISNSHELLSEAHEVMSAWPRKHQLTTASWNYLQGQKIVVFVDPDQTTIDFVWADEISLPESAKTTAIAFYDRASELGFGWKEPALRAIVLLESMGEYAKCEYLLNRSLFTEEWDEEMPIAILPDNRMPQAKQLISTRLLLKLNRIPEAIRSALQVSDFKSDHRFTILSQQIVEAALASESFWTEGDTSLELNIDACIQLIGYKDRLEVDLPRWNELLENLLDKASTEFRERRQDYAQLGRLADSVDMSLVAAKYSMPSTSGPAKSVSLANLEALSISSGSVSDSKSNMEQSNYRRALMRALDGIQEAKAGEGDSIEPTKIAIDALASHLGIGICSAY